MKKYLSFVLISLLACGCCRQTIQVTESDALELCLDSVGFYEDEIANIDVEENIGYGVFFESCGNNYSFQVNTDGQIIERSITPIVEQEETKKDEIITESSPAPTAEQTEKEEKEEEVSEVLEPLDEQEPVLDNEAFREHAFNNALVYLGLTGEDILESAVTDEEDGTRTVWFYVIDGRNIITVTDYEGNPLDAYLIE